MLGHLPTKGETIDRYTVLAELAHGGMAAVFAVGRVVGGFDKVFAMKVMLPHLVSEERFVNMFLDEARIAANVQHPNVVQVFDVGYHERTPYLVMEYLKGQSLSALRRRTRLPPAALLEILACAADGLHAAHETCSRSGEPLEIVHRDVSPQNIHVSYDGSVKVVDFGIAAAAGRITQTRTGEIKGKFGYAAPEQLRKGRTPIDRRLDLWALGVIAYEVLGNVRLFRGQDDAETMFNVLKRDIPPLHEHVSDLPDLVYETIHMCLERMVELRPATALEVARAFRQAAAELGAVDAAELGAIVSEAFVEERAVENERVAAAIGATPMPTREAEPGSGRARVRDPDGASSLATPTRAPKTRRVVAAAAAILLAGAGGVLWAQNESAPSVDATIDGTISEAPESTPEGSASETRETPPTPVPVLNEEPIVTMEEPIEAEMAERASPMRRRPGTMRRQQPMEETPMATSMRTLADQDLMPLAL